MFRLNNNAKKINKTGHIFEKADEAGRFLFLYFILQNNRLGHFYFSPKTNEAPFLFILSIKMLIF